MTTTLLTQTPTQTQMEPQTITGQILTQAQPTQARLTQAMETTTI